MHSNMQDCTVYNSNSIETFEMVIDKKKKNSNTVNFTAISPRTIYKCVFSKLHQGTFFNVGKGREREILHLLSTSIILNIFCVFMFIKLSNLTLKLETTQWNLLGTKLENNHCLHLKGNP